MAPNVGRYGEPGDDQRPNRDGRLLDDARLDDARLDVAQLDDVGLPDDDDRRNVDNGQCHRFAYRFNPRRAVVYAEATYEQPDDRDDPYGRRAALIEPAEEDEHPSWWAPDSDRPATPTDNHGRHLSKSLLFTEDWSRPSRACLPAAHDECSPGSWRTFLTEEKPRTWPTLAVLSAPRSVRTGPGSIAIYTSTGSGSPPPWTSSRMRGVPTRP